VDGNRLLMTDNLGQKFFLVPQSPASGAAPAPSAAPARFLVEDMEVPVYFDMGDGARAVRITLDASPAWKISGKRIEASGR